MISQSPELKNLFAALAEAQAEMPIIKKSSVANKYKYAQLEDILPITTPILKKHGLSVTQFAVSNEQYEEVLVTTIQHSSGEYIRGALRMIVVPLNFNKSEINQQAVGSAISYYRRYCYVSALCLNIAGEDDDGYAAAQALSHYKPEYVSDMTLQQLQEQIKLMPKDEGIKRFTDIKRYNRVEKLEDLTEEQALRALRTFKK